MAVLKFIGMCWPGLARILALVGLLTAAALAGAVTMADMIARDELNANRHAEHLFMEP